MEVHTADSIVRGFYVYGHSWSPVIGVVLVCGLLSKILLSRLEHGPVKIAKLNSLRKFQHIRYPFNNHFFTLVWVVKIIAQEQL